MAVVGIASGIWLVARGTKATEDRVAEESTASETVVEHQISEKEMRLYEIGYKLDYIERLIDTYFLFDEEAEKEDPIDWMYIGYVASLQDPYSSYYSEEEYQSLKESTEGEYCGIGVMVSQNVYTGLVTVIKVFKDAPADVAGMLPGDIITAVEGMDISGMDLSLVVGDHIKGEEGTEVSLTVYREAINDYVDLTMTRRIVQNPTVEFEMLEEQIGYIALSSFEDVSTDQFIEAVDALEAQEMKGLIVDLRNNGGGVVDAAEDIADYLIPDGKDIVSFKGKGVEDSTYVAQDGHQLDVPIVVLVNGQSASASEVLTGALKDNEAALVVGTKTYGKGIAQGIFSLPDGSALKLTTAYYYVPSGECIHKKGIEPDVLVGLDEELETMVEIPKEDDNQIRAAIDVLLEGEDVVKARLEAERVEQETEAGAAD
ncbi:MAG: S41 family peptidase [Lachnospiraceae bacterium]|nr:S41 family peptidase [Lachnospiraceae bacterium]